MKKPFSFLQLVLICAFTISCFAASVPQQQIQATSPHLSADQLSVPLIAAAMEKNTEAYHDLLSRMVKALSTPSNHNNINNNINTSLSHQAWLLGRILLAAQNIDDQPTAKKAANIMLGLLENNKITYNEYYAWAWAYLADYYADQPKLYNKYKLEMFNAADYYVTQYPAQIENIAWIRVMELQAVADAKDDLQYKVILQALKKNTKQSSLVNALDTIPIEDYQAWAKAIVMDAAAKTNDEKTYNLMKNATEKAIALSSKDNNAKVLNGVTLAKLITQNTMHYQETILTEAKSPKPADQSTG